MKKHNPTIQNLVIILLCLAACLASCNLMVYLSSPQGSLIDLEYLMRIIGISGLVIIFLISGMWGLIKGVILFMDFLKEGPAIFER